MSDEILTEAKTMQVLTEVFEGDKEEPGELDEQGRMVIGGGKAKAPGGKDLRLQPNTAYFIGYSSSPTMVIVDRVSGGMVSYHDAHTKKSSGVQEWVFRDLAVVGMHTWLKGYARYQPEMAKTIRALLDGKKVRPNGQDFDQFRVVVQGQGDEDLWREAERYGGVGGFVDAQNKFEITLDRSSLNDLKKNKKFKILSVKEEDVDETEFTGQVLSEALEMEGAQVQSESAEWDDEARELVKLLRKKWRNVTYKESDGTGTANLAHFQIEFQQSGNDPAVIVSIKNMGPMKADPKNIMKALDAIGKIYNRTGL